jgi:uncharacterized protein
VIHLYPEWEGFEWDRGNKDKNWIKHRVLNSECEQVFFNEPLVVVNDEAHSDQEKRFFAFGKTDQERKLIIVFTVRKGLIRVISARDMSRKEGKLYETYEKNS